MLDNHDFTRRGKVAQAGFNAEWMTLLVATDPPLRSRTSRSETCRQAPSTSTRTSQQRAVAPRPLRQHLRGHTDYRPLPLQAIVRAELVDGRTPAGESTIERLRGIGAVG